jgi:hypothetical protein
VRDNPEGKVAEEKNGIYILDRTRFCNKLRKEYKSYLEELRKPERDNLKFNFIDGMDDIVEKCRKLR